MKYFKLKFFNINKKNLWNNFIDILKFTTIVVKFKQSMANKSLEDEIKIK